jgi:succinate-semialdehyde dehydrogenase/glutarate-semialdehyde dehydrogenase
MTFVATNPTTGDTIASYPMMSEEGVNEIILAAQEAHLIWSKCKIPKRTEMLTVLGSILRKRKEEFGRLMTLEMGKPIQQSISESEKCAWVCDYYAEHAEHFLAPVPAPTDATISYWTHRPLGIVLGIMPWNFPFWQVVRFAVPALTAGNAVLLKHSPSVPGCAEILAHIFAEAGYPDGLFTNLVINLETTGEVIDHPLVRAISLTGSVQAGRSVASRAGAAIKKCVLELGGSDPSVILADADIDDAVACCTLARTINSGQSCVAAKRFVVVEPVREEFEAKLVTAMAATVMGDPLNPASDIGPLAREDLRDTLHNQVQRSVNDGALLLTGGEPPDEPGWWYPPTVLTNVGPGMAAYEEELFGPVASILPVCSEEEAIRVANDTAYGLGASVYTEDSARGERIAAELIDAGNCFVNGIVKSDPRLPFGGTKDSGYGRELSPLGILEFTYPKTIWVK